MRRRLCAVVSALLLHFSPASFADEPAKPAPVEEKNEKSSTEKYLSSCDTLWSVGRTVRDDVPYPTLSYLNIRCRYGFRFHQHTQHHDNRDLSIKPVTVTGPGETRRYLIDYERRAFTFGHAFSSFGAKAQVAWLFGMLIEAERIHPSGNGSRITYDIDLDFQVGAVPTVSADYSFGWAAFGLSSGAGVVKKNLFGFADAVLSPDESWLNRLFDPDTFVQQWNVYATVSFPGWK